MHPPVGMPRPPPAGYAPSSFPQAPHPRPAPSTLPLPRPTARPAGPPPSLQPPGQATPPRPSAAPGPPVGKPALKAPEPVKKLMASVTFIAPSVENEFLDKLFAVFGAVKSMKRPQDPSTNVRKTFAFVEFETPESLKIALKVRLFHQIQVSGMATTPPLQSSPLLSGLHKALFVLETSLQTPVVYCLTITVSSVSVHQCVSMSTTLV